MQPLSTVGILIVFSALPAAAWQMQLDRSLANAGGLSYQLSDERRIPPGWSDGLTFSTTSRSECARLIQQNQMSAGRNRRLYCFVAPPS